MATDAVQTAVGRRPLSIPFGAAEDRSPEDSNGWLALLVRPSAWIPVLILQSALAFRVNGPISTDEATYLVAGREIVRNMLWGTPVQDYASYFSGIPGLYPVFGAAVAHVAGVQGARFFSLLCMLLVNMCLYLITARLFGRPSAVFASLLFALGSGASFLAWYATFDAPSLALLAVATLLAFIAAERRGIVWAAAVGALLMAAIAVKFFSLEFVPVVLGLLAMRSMRLGGARRMLSHVAAATGALAAAAALTVVVMSESVWSGLASTSTSDRRILNQADRFDLIGTGASVIGLWLLFSGIGFAIIVSRRSLRWEAGLLFAAGFLPLVTHLVLAEETSMHKHTAFGFFFAAPLAGLAVASCFALGRSRPAPGRSLGGAVVPIAASAVLLLMLGTGMASAATMKFGWPEEERIVAAVDPYIDSSGRYLTDSAGIPAYLFDDRTTPGQWTSPWYFDYAVGDTLLTGTAALVRAVDDGFFNLIAYRPQTFTDAQREQLLPAIAAHYRLVFEFEYAEGKTWYVWVPAG